MKARIIITVLLSLTFFAGYTQKSIERDLASYDKIEVFGNIQVYLSQGKVGTITIDAREVDPSEVVTEIKDKHLKIKMKSNLFEDVTVKVFVNYQELTEITAHGAAEIIVKDRLKTDQLIVLATSGGRITLEALLNSAKLKAYQGGHIDITGQAKLQESFINTGGVLSAANFACEEVIIKMNTGGNADVFVSQKIDARVNTGASLSVYGKAKQEILKTSLGGEIIQWNE
ncbi:MAG: head GIN domain-containing protein [Bacteroidales bacterium]|jgi:hypothetical protein|nr:head GIN domain-containing protein [Bacteroidales bacterium]